MPWRQTDNSPGLLDLLSIPHRYKKSGEHTWNLLDNVLEEALHFFYRFFPLHDCSNTKTAEFSSGGV